MQNNEMKDILSKLECLFPNASCELIYHNKFELLIAVVLSAQTTDKAVNKVTPVLFEKYPNCNMLKDASINDVISIIKPIGLSLRKAKSIIDLSKTLVEKYDGVIPSNRFDLEKLPGVGRKTANVILSEGFNIPAIAVDTHVERVSKRLGIVDDDKSVVDVEKELERLIDKSYWHKAHHLLLFMGRYKCLAKKPLCNDCFYKDKCKYYNSIKK